MYKPRFLSPDPRDLVGPDRKTSRQAAWVMLVLTTVYLVWELAFNARLLDVVGEVGDFEEVEALEVWGRLISGAALALVYIGSRLGRAGRYGISPGQIGAGWIGILAVSATLMAGMFFGQKWVIDQLVDSSSAEAKRRAAVLVPMTSLVRQGRVEFPSLQLGLDAYASPEGKTFLATLPLQAVSHPDLFPRIEAVGVERLFEAYAENLRGPVEDFFKVYRDSVDALEQKYSGPYTEANKRFQREVGQLMAQHKSSAWADYERRLSQQRRGLRPNNIPRRYWSRVRNDVIASGVPVPQNWVPSDRATFNAAVERTVRQRALDTFRIESRAQTGLQASLDPGLSLTAFLRHPAVAASWRSALALPEGMVPVAGLDSARFTRTVYAPAIAADVTRMVRSNYASVKDYERGGTHYRAGAQAYRALIVPPIALVFSLLGALTHIFKIGMFAAKVIQPVPVKWYWSALAGYLLLAAMLPFLAPNQVTQQKLFMDLERYTTEGMNGGVVVAGGIRWATQFQPYFYPVNEFVRTSVLPSPKFDHKLFATH